MSRFEFSYFAAGGIRQTSRPEPITLASYVSLVSSHPILMKSNIVRKETDPSEQEAKKQSLLPYITPHGSFSKRGDAGFVAPSGLVCLDFDYTDPQEIKRKAAGDPHTVFAATSARGKGAYVFIMLAETVKAPDQLKEALKQAGDYWERTHGEACDRNAFGLSRARFVSYDAAPFYSLENKVPFVPKIDKPTDKPQPLAPVAGNPLPQGDPDPDMAEKLAHEFATKDKGAFTGQAGNRNAYVFQWAAIMKDYGIDQGETQFRAQQFIGADFTNSEIANTVKSAYTGARASTFGSKAEYVTPRAAPTIPPQGKTDPKATNKTGEKRESEVNHNFASCLLSLEQLEAIPDPVPVISIGGIPTLTRGNFSVITGQAKSKKSFFCRALVIATLTGGYEAIECGINESKVLYIDTEQHPSHLKKVALGIKAGTGLSYDKMDERIDFVSMRNLATNERRDLTDYCIKYKKYDLIILDGIRDLLHDFNDPQESHTLINDLLRWSADTDTHIVCVLHQNKGNEHLRGHLGTEATNKAETVLSLKKEGEGSLVSCAQARNREFAPLFVSWGMDGVPIVSEAERHGRKIDLSEGALRAILPHLPRQGVNTKAKAKQAIRIAYEAAHGQLIGGNKQLDALKTMQRMGIYAQEGANWVPVAC